ncbi:hypothetical protein MYVA_1330 [Mycolicibacterium vaccae 95051]|nr:hypothetical protein MYVA_1330 [Mycolicibacterium vaccae 95051]
MQQTAPLLDTAGSPGADDDLSVFPAGPARKPVGIGRRISVTPGRSGSSHLYDDHTHRTPVPRPRPAAHPAAVALRQAPLR